MPSKPKPDTAVEPPVWVKLVLINSTPSTADSVPALVKPLLKNAVPPLTASVAPSAIFAAPLTINSPPSITKALSESMLCAP